MAKKKISRKALLKTEDEFISISSRLIRFILTHRQKLALACGGIIVLLVIFSGIRYASIQSEKKAFALMESAWAGYQTLQQSQGPQKAYRQAKTDFEPLLEKYSGKNGGKLARVLFAGICLNAGESDLAIDLYQKALNDFDDADPLKYFVFSGLAAAYDAKKDFPNAIAYLETMVAAPDAILKDEAYFNLGRIYAAMENRQKSREAYQKIVSDYSGSIFSRLAAEKVAG